MTPTMRFWAASALACMAAGCQMPRLADSPPDAPREESTMSVTSQPWGEADGRRVQLFTLDNGRGLKMRVTNYGGIIVSLEVPDRDGRPADVVLGFDRLGDYLAGHPYFGALIGRYGNRIAGGRFLLDGVEYRLATNNAPGGIPCSLHGGLRGFDQAVWEAEPVRERDAVGLRLRHVSRDGDEGYPGTLRVTVHYWLTADQALRITYEAATDKPTPVNLTQHSYFNLAGHDGGPILDHELQLLADRFTPVDAGLIPTGELRPVEGTPMDFRTPVRIGARIDQADEQLRFGGGYDHNWVINGPAGTLRLAAVVHEPKSGRVMEVLTTEPGVQFYSGNFLDGSNVGKGGVAYAHRTGFCLETQHFPDSPNKPHFPSTILRPGQTLRSETVYRFSVRPR